MSPNKTRFRIVLESALSGARWSIIDPVTNKSLAYSQTYEGAIKAAKEIETPFDDPVNKIREGWRFEHLGKVLAARYKEING